MFYQSSARTYVRMQAFSVDNLIFKILIRAKSPVLDHGQSLSLSSMHMLCIGSHAATALVDRFRVLPYGSTRTLAYYGV